MIPTLDELDAALDRARRTPEPQRSHGELLYGVIKGLQMPRQDWRELSKQRKQFWQDSAGAFFQAIHEESKAWHLRNSRFERFHLAVGRLYARIIRRAPWRT